MALTSFLLEVADVLAQSQLDIRGDNLPLVTRDSTQSFVYKQSSAPTGGMSAGDVFVDTDNGQLFTYSGSAWVQQTAGALGAASTTLMVNSGGTALEYGSSGTIKHIGSQVLGAEADTLTVSSISPTYDAYLVIITVKGTGSTNGLLRVGNGGVDTGNNYSYYTNDTGTPASASGVSYVAVHQAASIVDYQYTIWINNGLATTTKGIYFTGNRGGGSSVVGAGYWNNSTNLIDTIQFLNTDTGGFMTGSKITVKGINFTS